MKEYIKTQVTQGHVLHVLQTMHDELVNCIVTSPPYYGLRDYNMPPVIWPAFEYIPMAGLPPVAIPAMECCLGLEPDPLAFVGHMVLIFREARRVLKKDGIAWVNFGDSYITERRHRTEEQSILKSGLQGGKGNQKQHLIMPAKKSKGLKNKNLLGIPWKIAFALQADGWYLRQDIIWNKPNPMPESVTDRCTKAHEYIFLISKSKKYFYNAKAIYEPLKDESIRRLAQELEAQELEAQEGSKRVVGKTNGNMKAVVRNDYNSSMAISGAINHHGKKGYFDAEGKLLVNSLVNKKSVWTITTKPFKDAHFAVFPTDIPEICVKAGCPEGGAVMDLFDGSGTTREVCNRMGLTYYGIEINPDYIEISNKRNERFINELF